MSELKSRFGGWTYDIYCLICGLAGLLLQVFMADDLFVFFFFF